MFKRLYQHFADRYLDEPVQTMPLPSFPPDDICRYRVQFSGSVQGVGFRLEAALLAQRLGLTGFCENLPDGDVLAEIQGPENRVLFLITHLEDLKRALVTGKTISFLPVQETETDFQPIY